MARPEDVKRLIEKAGGKVIEGPTPLPDGSGFAVASFPLPPDHWLRRRHDNVPPMPFRLGTDDPRHADYVRKVSEAARYAIRAATMNGQHDDYDPDAMVQNFVVGMLGYHTPDGLNSSSWGNPVPVPPRHKENS